MLPLSASCSFVFHSKQSSNELGTPSYVASYSIHFPDHFAFIDTVIDRLKVILLIIFGS